MDSRVIQQHSSTLSYAEHSLNVRQHEVRPAAVKFGERQYTWEEECRMRELLSSDIPAERVSYRDGPGRKPVAYIEHGVAVEVANEIFGNFGWSTEIKDLQGVFSINEDGRWNIGYRATLSVILANGSRHEDVGFGTSKNSHVDKAHENAMKSAVSDARKRCLRNFGRATGGSLYDHVFVEDCKKRKNEGVQMAAMKAQKIHDTKPIGSSPLAEINQNVPRPSHSVKMQQKSPSFPQQQNGNQARTTNNHLQKPNGIPHQPPQQQQQHHQQQQQQQQDLNGSRNQQSLSKTSAMQAHPQHNISYVQNKTVQKLNSMHQQGASNVQMHKQQNENPQKNNGNHLQQQKPPMHNVQAQNPLKLGNSYNQAVGAISNPQNKVPLKAQSFPKANGTPTQQLQTLSSAQPQFQQKHFQQQANNSSKTTGTSQSARTNLQTKTPILQTPQHQIKNQPQGQAPNTISQHTPLQRSPPMYEKSVSQINATPEKSFLPGQQIASTNDDPFDDDDAFIAAAEAADARQVASLHS